MDSMNIVGMNLNAPVTPEDAKEYREVQKVMPAEQNDILQEQSCMTEEVKPYTLRKLEADDIFPMAKILGKIGINECVQYINQDEFKEFIKEFFNGKQNDNSAEPKERDSNSEFIAGVAVIARISNIILLHLEDCRSEIYTLLSRLSGMNIEEIKKLELEVFLEMIVDVIRKEEFKNFYKVASKFIE